LTTVGASKQFWHWGGKGTDTGAAATGGVITIEGEMAGTIGKAKFAGGGTTTDCESMGAAGCGGATTGRAAAPAAEPSLVLACVL